MSPSEDVFASAIFNVLERRLTDEELRDISRDNRAAWGDALRGHVAIQVDDKEYRGEGCFDLIVNGSIFHVDEAKATEYAALPDFMQVMIHQEMIGLVELWVRTSWLTQAAS